jgi:hypothetical protein
LFRRPKLTMSCSAEGKEGRKYRGNVFTFYSKWVRTVWTIISARLGLESFIGLNQCSCLMLFTLISGFKRLNSQQWEKRWHIYVLPVKLGFDTNTHYIF